MNILRLISVGALAGIISFCITPFIIKFANMCHLVDDPKKRSHPAHTHKGIIPRAGGLGIYIAILITSLVFLTMSKILAGVLIGGLLIVIMGLLDDYFDMSPYVRFALNITIVSIVILFGLGIQYITNPLGGVIQLDTFNIHIDALGGHDFLFIANLFSLLWIVAIMNFINWSSGVDGQLSGFVAVSSFILALLALRFTAHDISSFSVVLLSIIVGCSFLGFMPWNFYPQKIMPGYSGGALAGFMLGVLSILSWGKLGTLLLVLSVPIVDASYVIARRLKNRKSPFKGDDGHFHHKLLAIGWGRRRIAVFYWIVSLLFGIASLVFEREQKILAIFLVIILLALFIVIVDRIKARPQE